MHVHDLVGCMSRLDCHFENVMHMFLIPFKQLTRTEMDQGFSVSFLVLPVNISVHFVVKP